MIELFIFLALAFCVLIIGSILYLNTHSEVVKHKMNAAFIMGMFSGAAFLGLILVLYEISKII